MISNRQYTANFTWTLLKQAVCVLIIVFPALLFSQTSVEEISLKISSQPDPNEDSLPKQGKVQIYIVSGTVTSNLTESPSVEITYLPSSDKSKKEKKINLEKNQKKTEQIAQKVKKNVEEVEPKNYKTTVFPKSPQPPSLFAGKNSSDVIVPARDYRLKVFENTPFANLWTFIKSKNIDFVYYLSYNIKTSNSSSLFVRPPPTKNYTLFLGVFENKTVVKSGLLV